MSAQLDWVIIREAAPRDLCADVSAQLDTDSTPSEKDGYDQYYAPPESARIAEAAHKKSAEQLTRFDAGLRPTSVNVCKFRRLHRPVAKITGQKNTVYLVVALTPLSEESGMFAVRGLGDCDEADRTKMDQVAVPRLEVGDALLWRGENSGRSAEGAGGIMQVITFSR